MADYEDIAPRIARFLDSGRLPDAIDRTEISYRVSRYFNALDSKDWATCLDSFEPLFDADYTSMVGGEPLKDQPREINMHAWEGMMAGFDATHHQIGNLEIEQLPPLAPGDEKHTRRAHLTAKVTATHILKTAAVEGDGEQATTTTERWITKGTYKMVWITSAPAHLAMSNYNDGGHFSPDWRIRSITYSQVDAEGTPTLMQKAAAVVQSRKQQ